MAFSVSTATITGVAPAIAAPGAWVTITGSGFGGSQGSGNVWLGGTIAAIQRTGGWSDGQIVAQVPTGTTGTGAQVLQNGVMSNVGTFTVDALLLTGIGPTPGSSPPAFTLTGTGFGASGTVWLGDRAGNAVSWSDTQVVATADPQAKSGVAKILQNGVWSNAKPFIVTVPGGNMVVPSVLNMVVGYTRSIQALNSSSQPVTGLTWTSSDPTVVSLSTDDPPVLTAVAAGNVTITAGTGSADVTVYAGSLPLGTVIWSNPGDGSGVTKIVPAVPSSSGVADVFAFQNDGMVQAITSDGTTAWTADVSQTSLVLPDFLGGLVELQTDQLGLPTAIVKLDGITGQPYPAYTAPCYVPGGSGSVPCLGGLMAVHPDGTVFAVLSGGVNFSVGAIDPTTGTLKFNVLGSPSVGDGVAEEEFQAYQLIIAGDGYAYLAYKWAEFASDNLHLIRHFMVLRANSFSVHQVR
jgi:hypothetical protein